MRRGACIADIPAGEAAASKPRAEWYALLLYGGVCMRLEPRVRENCGVLAFSRLIASRTSAKSRNASAC